MLDIFHKKQYVVFAVLFAFLVGKVFDLHMHGHIESSHTHSENLTVHKGVDHHDELHDDKDTHVVSIFNDIPNILSHADSEHGHKTFDIETESLAEKVKVGLDLETVFLVVFFVLSILFTQRVIDVRPLREFRTSFQQCLYTKNHPLRAPPLRA